MVGRLGGGIDTKLGLGESWCLHGFRAVGKFLGQVGILRVAKDVWTWELSEASLAAWGPRVSGT